MSWKMFLDYRPFDNTSRLFIRREEPGAMMPGRPIGFVSNLELKNIDPMMEAPAALKSSGFGHDDEAKAFLQAALDFAWDAGMRPAGWADHGREVTALRDHLFDLRALVYSLGGTDAAALKPPPPLHSEQPANGRQR